MTATLMLGAMLLNGRPAPELYFDPCSVVPVEPPPKPVTEQELRRFTRDIA
jgi:hypothetical protein